MSTEPILEPSSLVPIAPVPSSRSQSIVVDSIPSIDSDWLIHSFYGNKKNKMHFNHQNFNLSAAYNKIVGARTTTNPNN